MTAAPAPTIVPIEIENDALREELGNAGISFWMSSSRLNAYIGLTKPLPPVEIEPWVRKVGIVVPLFMKLISDESVVKRAIEKAQLVPITKRREDGAKFPDVDFSLCAQGEEIRKYFEEKFGPAGGKSLKLPLFNIPAGACIGRRLTLSEVEAATVATDIFGQKTDKGSAVVPLKLGTGLAQSEDGKICATENGCLVSSHDQLILSNIFKIGVQQDWEGGTLNFIGSVEVAQGVVEAFDISAGESITIKGSTESANLKAGKDIILSEGLIGQLNAHIEAGNSVKARYTNQAVINAGGDCEFNAGSFHSLVHAYGLLKVASGPIVGGVHYGANGITAHTLGASAGTRTIVAAGFWKEAPKSLDQMYARRQRLAEELKKLAEKIGELVKLKDAGHKFSSTERAVLQEGGDEIKRLKEQIAELTVWIDAHPLEPCEKAVVHVSGTVFPGVVVFLHNVAFAVQEKLNYVIFAYDPQTSSIVVKPAK
ncbi:MAG: DUF342 domain-containing protein [Myxococcales bacterium]|nr:MAG: DUF342 domain-containing protein [Myxococcales bacterium]